MLEDLRMSRDVGDGKYGDVLDAAEELGAGDYGSATNALAVMARQSQLYIEATARIAARREAEKADPPAPRPLPPTPFFSLRRPPNEP